MFKVKARSTVDAPVDDVAFQEDLNDNPLTLSTVDLEDEETSIEYNELMELDPEEVNSSHDEDENKRKMKMKKTMKNKINMIMRMRMRTTMGKT